MTQYEPHDHSPFGTSSFGAVPDLTHGGYSNGGYAVPNGNPNGNGNGNGNGYHQPVYAPGFPPTAFMSMPTSYPAPFTPVLEPANVTVAATRPAPLPPAPTTQPTTQPTPTSLLSNGNGNGHHAPMAKPNPAPMQMRLSDLVVRAESAIDELQRLASTALDATAASSQAAIDLQERLRLGVRMLQAFDVQIQRCEQVGTQAGPQVGMQMAAQFTNQMNAMAQQCEMRVRGAIEALDQRMHESLPFLDERLRQAHEQVGRLVEERLANAERRIEDRYGPARDDLRRFADELATGFAQRLDVIVKERNEALMQLAEREQATSAPRLDPAEMAATMTAPIAAFEERVRTLLADAERRATTVEATLGAADTRLHALIRESTEAADGLLGTVGTASTLKDLIADEARASRRLADEAHATSRDLQRDMQDMLERCTMARGSLEQQLHDLRAAAAETESRLEAAKALRSEIESTLEQVRTTEVAHEPRMPRDGLLVQHVVETISSNVRQTLAEDMRNFSAALRGLAARAEHAFATARFDEFSAMPEPMTTPSPLLNEHFELDAPQLNGNAVTDVHAGSISTLPIDTRRLTAEIMALDATTLLRTPHHA
jgi:hypothetical protein